MVKKKPFCSMVRSYRGNRKGTGQPQRDGTTAKGTVQPQKDGTTTVEWDNRNETNVFFFPLKNMEDAGELMN